MGRGGGGGSSGRSGGGGGHSSSRSSGGRSHSSSSSRGGSFGGRSRSHSSPHMHYSPPPGRGRGMRPPHHYASPAPPSMHTGCLMPSTGFAILLLVILFALIFGHVSSSASSITRSTVEREPLEAEYVITTDWYTDELGWINNDTTLESGMKYFYKKTGVQPYLYITDVVNDTTSPSEDDMDTYANELYDELFEDEGHILLLFYEHNSDSDYKTWYVCGAMAKTVMDQEACDILLDYIDHYYFSSLSEDEMFSSAFEDAAERIMTVTKSPLATIIIAIIALIILIIAFRWWKHIKTQKNFEALQTERILNADIGTLSDEDPELKDLEGKYVNYFH